MEEQRLPIQRDPLHEPSTNGNGIIRRERILRQNNRVGPNTINPDEQIIQSRGRREMPRTPVRKSPRKRPIEPVFASPNTTTKSKGPIESPLTKCLRGLTSPDSATRRYHPEQSSIVRRLNSIFGEPKDKQHYYYSPTTYKLRSSDRHLNDSGIEVTPDISISSTSSSIEIVSPESNSELDSSFSSQTSFSTTISSTSSTSTSNRRINRVRRRFRF